MKPLLAISSLSVSYGEISAVRNIQMHVQPGELVALIGSNGAGKSSTLNCIAGLLKPRNGTIQYQEQFIESKPPYARQGLGIALVPEGRGIFMRLSVMENLQLGAYSCKDQSIFQQRFEHILELFPRIRERLKQTAGTLSGGEQQMLALGRAMMSAPQLLLLDEPSMGLSPLMVEKILGVIQSINQEGGVSILLVEQNANLALQMASRAYVMDAGEIILEGEASNLIEDPMVQSAYLGRC